MTTKNDITGDAIKSKGFSKDFEDNFDRIFRKEATQELCKICGKVLNEVRECAWTSCPKWLNEWDEKRMDNIGQNGNDGLHYDKEQS